MTAAERPVWNWPTTIEATKAHWDEAQEWWASVYGPVLKVAEEDLGGSYYALEPSTISREERNRLTIFTEVFGWVATMPRDRPGGMPELEEVAAASHFTVMHEALYWTELRGLVGDVLDVDALAGTELRERPALTESGARTVALHLASLTVESAVRKRWGTKDGPTYQSARKLLPTRMVADMRAALPDAVRDMRREERLRSALRPSVTAVGCGTALSAIAAAVSLAIIVVTLRRTRRTE